MTITAILPIPAELAHRPEAVFAQVAGQSSLERIVRTLNTIGSVVVATAQQLSHDVATALSAPGFPAARMVVAASPGRRRECIAAGTRGLDGGSVLLHDVNWPLFSLETLDGVVSALGDGADAVLPACVVSDSIKAVDGRGAVTETVDRSPLRTVQYPRGFCAGTLARLLRDSADGDFDELAVVLTSGTPVVLVDGDTAVNSIELPRDADYLGAVIASREIGPSR